MSNSLIYFSPYAFRDKKISIFGLDSFLEMQRIFAGQNGIKDRTNTIITPLKQNILFPIPEFTENFKLSYTECAMNQVANIENIHIRTGKKIRLLYSGGIDSTGILSAFIGYFGLEKTSKILEICCSKESIYENPVMWEKYISKNNFKLLSSHQHNGLWDDDVITIMGEGNDQLIGLTQMFVYWIQFVNNNDIFCTVNEDMFVNFLNKQKFYKITNKKSIDLILELLKKSPFPLDNLYKISWWLFFTLAWESLMIRSTCATLRSSFPIDFYDIGLIQFYNTLDFQRWSFDYINNFNKNCVLNYKAPTKEMIFNIVDLPGYENKVKTMSWPRLHSMIPCGLMIDNENKIHRNIEDFYQFIEPGTSFL
jgi:hypothetical protein